MSKRSFFIFGVIALAGVILTAVLVPLSKRRHSQKNVAPVFTNTSSFQEVVTGLMNSNLLTTLATPATAPVVNVESTTPTSTANTIPVEEGDKAPASNYDNSLFGRIAQRGWNANTPVCYPQTSTEVINMVTGTGCTVIIITKDFDIKQQMNVTSTKIVIGNPITLPKLNATGRSIHRLFEGGYVCSI